MKKEEFFDILKTILDQSGMAEMVEVSSQAYETADFCVINDIYLGLNNTRTVPFECIERISYVAGEDNPRFQYVGGLLQIVFKIRGDIDFVYEIGNQGDSYWIITPGHHFIDRPSEVELFFDEYNADFEIQHNLCAELQHIPFFEDSQKELAIRYALVWKKEALSYIDSHSDCVNRDEVIFDLICSALYFRVVKNSWIRDGVTADDYDELIKILPVEVFLPLLATKSKVIAFIAYARTGSIFTICEDMLDEAEVIVMELLQNRIEDKK